MESREPNSKGFWRRNTIEGLRMELQGFRPPYGDPEEKERHERLVQELKDQESREDAVRRRMTRAGQYG